MAPGQVQKEIRTCERWCTPAGCSRCWWEAAQPVMGFPWRAERSAECGTCGRITSCRRGHVWLWWAWRLRRSLAGALADCSCSLHVRQEYQGDGQHVGSSCRPRIRGRPGLGAAGLGRAGAVRAGSSLLLPCQVPPGCGRHHSEGQCQGWYLGRFRLDGRRSSLPRRVLHTRTVEASPSQWDLARQSRGYLNPVLAAALL